MFKLVLCAVFVSFTCAAPGYVGHYPGAVSHVSRVDVHDSKPIIGGYESPLGYAPVAYAPSVGYAPGGHYGFAPRNYGYGYGYPPAHSYSNRIDVHNAAAVVASPYGHGYGGYGIHDGNGYGYVVPGYGIQGLHHGY